MSIDGGRLLLALRVAKPARRRGFCPACIVDVDGVEVASDGVTAAIVLGVATVAWAVTVWRMLGAGMAMGLGSIASFAGIWTAMMTAMMLPSAIPLVYRFARQAEGRRARPTAVAVLILVYLAVWVVFGVVAYIAYSALRMPWANHAVVGAVALGVAALYALTPLQRISARRCREVHALHGALPFDLVRAGALAGWRYGLSCLGCSAGLMVAMVLIGMTSLVWAVVLAAMVFAYKFVPTASWRVDVGMAALVGALAVVFAVVG
jgi:predicted metal-binding membrane protein